VAKNRKISEKFVQELQKKNNNSHHGGSVAKGQIKPLFDFMVKANIISSNALSGK
jgi:hypothetical protein